MFCPACGKKNPDSARFCARCGRAFMHGSTSSVKPKASPAGITKVLPFIGIAAVVVAAVLLVSNVIGGRGTAQELADELTASSQRVIDESLSDDSVREYAAAFVDAMPPEGLEMLIEEGLVDSRGEAIEQVGEGLLNSLSGQETVFHKADVEIKIVVGDEVDADYLDRVNEQFESHGKSIGATEGYILGGEVTITALEDVGVLETGQTATQSLDNTGYTAIKIGNKWYVWMAGANW